MGYRLHYAQHYAPKWEGGYFNWKSEEFAQLFHDKFEENGWINDAEDEAEVYRPDVEKYIQELLKKPQEINEYFDGDEGYTNTEVAEAFTEILKSDDDNIRLEWF